MSYIDLSKHIVTLANLPKCPDPMVSAYFDLAQTFEKLDDQFTRWVEIAIPAFEGKTREQFITASDRIKKWLLNNNDTGRSAAVFSRAGSPDFFLPLTFQVPLQTYFKADLLPAIFPLVEIKDRFNRFVVVLANRDTARIIEMNLGETSLELLAERPEAIDRHGREWTREHYNSQIRERNEKFVSEQVEIVERLMSKRGHNALILVGEPQHTDRLKNALPTHLSDKVVDHIRTGFTDQRIGAILEDVIESYLKVEDDESETAVKRLFRSYGTHQLGIFGIAASALALQNDQVEELIISSSLRHNEREVLVRVVSQHNVPIETVRESERLDRQGGVGAILRYSTVAKELGI
ncbi:MAG: hypothetical protein PVJ98_04220 [Akkermansiaceae bacterium]|jgi:protein required for attachment to host cells